MRSYNNLYEPMLQDDYIKQCFINASKKKKNRNDVREVLENLDEHTELLKKMLTEELFIPDYHKPSIINESSSKKTRRILKPHYKYEQVIHHCAIGQFKPIVMNGLYEFSCGSIPGRGVHYGKKYMRKWLDSYDGKKFFVLKMDVHHFFESINRRILKRKLKEVIRDKRFYRLLCILIEHDKIALVAKILTDAGVEIDAEQTKTLVGCIAFDDISGALEILQEIGITGAMFDELKEIIEEMRKGVPLGYFTSQWFGNFYLKALDHYIKEKQAYEDMVEKRSLGKDKQAQILVYEVEQRIKYEIMLEFGLAGNIGRTLEKSNCSVISFATEDIIRIADAVQERTINELGVLTAENSDSFKRMVIGYLNLMRTNGAFEDKVFDEYTMGDGNGYMLSNDRNRWLPGRQSGRNTPRFIAEHIGNGRSSFEFDSPAANKYVDWIASCCNEVLVDDSTFRAISMTM